MTESTLPDAAEAGRWAALYARFKHWSATPSAKWLWRILGGISFLVINGYMAYAIIKDWNQIRRFDWLHLNFGLLGVTAMVQLVGVCIAVYVWKFVMDRLGNNITYRQHFRAYAFSFLAQKLPGFGWSVISKVYLYGQGGADRVQVAVASSVEQIIAGISGALAALITLLVAGQGAAYFQPWVPIVAVVAFVAVLALPPVRKGLAHINSRRTNGQLSVPHILYWTAVATVVTLMGGVALFLFCQSLGFVTSASVVPLIQAWSLFVFAGALLFWFPVDVGINVAILIYVLTQQTTQSQAVIALVAWRVWNNLIVILWALIGLILTRAPKNQIKAAEPA